MTGASGQTGGDDDVLSGVVTLGEKGVLEGFALAGVELIQAETIEEARAGFPRLGPRVAVVILTKAARDAVADLLAARPEVLWTVMPG